MFPFRSMLPYRNNSATVEMEMQNKKFAKIILTVHTFHQYIRSEPEKSIFSLKLLKQLIIII